MYFHTVVRIYNVGAVNVLFQIGAKSDAGTFSEMAVTYCPYFALSYFLEFSIILDQVSMDLLCLRLVQVFYWSIMQ